MARRKSDGTDRHLIRDAVMANHSYFVRTARPIYALLFLLPFILLYEILVLAVNPQLLNEPVSNIHGAVVSFVWVQNFLHYIGMDTKSAWLFAPAVVILTLIVLQFTSRQSWRVRPVDFAVMACECIVLAMPLIVLALVLNRAPNPQSSFVNSNYKIATCQISYEDSGIDECPNQPDSESACRVFARRPIAMELLTGIGAGIYEELIFRLVLIGLSMMFFEIVLGISRTKAIIISVIVSSVLFSLHHHFVFLNGQLARTGEMLTMTRFAFRTIAGIFFAIIFAVRGFGMAAGTHAFYDIIATLLNAWLFEQG